MPNPNITQPVWFEVGRTQKLELCADEDVLDPRAMLKRRNSRPAIDTSGLELDFQPSVTDVISIAFKDVEPSELPVVAAAPARSWLAFALLALVACGLLVLVI